MNDIDKLPVTVIIHTLNEEKNIRNCLECVKWANEILVVDMFSNDDTVKIAKEYGAVIILIERLGYVEPAREFALRQAQNSWVLVVDADELVPLQLMEKLKRIIEDNKYDAVSIPHCNWFFGHAMKGTGWAPLQDTHIRFFKKGILSYANTIHKAPYLDRNARVYNIRDENLAFVHFNYIDVEHYFTKFNRYTTIEAKNSIDLGIKFSVSRAILAAFKEFAKRFFYQKGYKDKFQGFALALFMSSYCIASYLKLSLMEKYGGYNIEQPIIDYYNIIAEQERKKYEKFFS